MGIARLLDEQQPDNMNNPSTLTEEVSKNNDPKRPRTKQIFPGIDASLRDRMVVGRVRPGPHDGRAGPSRTA